MGGASRAKGAEGTTTLGSRPAFSPGEVKASDFPEVAPDDLGERGRRLWDRVTAEFAPSPLERETLVEACRTVDLLEALQRDVSEHGVTLPWGNGVRTNPAAAELRLQRVVLGRLVRALGVPEEEDE